MVTEVPISDQAQFAAADEHPAGMLQHGPGDGIADAVMLVKRRVDQHQVAASIGHALEAIAGLDYDHKVAKRIRELRNESKGPFEERIKPVE